MQIIYFSEPHTNFAGAATNITRIPGHPESLAEYMMHTLYQLIDTEKDVKDLLNDSGQQAVAEFQRHPKLKQYAGGRKLETDSPLAVLVKNPTPRGGAFPLAIASEQKRCFC